MTSAVVVVAGCASTQSPVVDLETPQNSVRVLSPNDKVTTRVVQPNQMKPASNPVRVAQADTASSKEMANGWVITVYPRGQEAMVGRIIQPTPSPIKFEGHERLVPRGTPVVFQGEGIFLAKNSGKHVFIIRSIVGSGRGDYWDIFANMSINDDKILKINSKQEYDRDIWFRTDNKLSATVTKSLDIEPGEYNIAFEFGGRPSSDWYPGSHSLEILVIEPGGSEPRHLRPDEIIHYRN